MLSSPHAGVNQPECLPPPLLELHAIPLVGLGAIISTSFGEVRLGESSHHTLEFQAEFACQAGKCAPTAAQWVDVLMGQD